MRLGLVAQASCPTASKELSGVLALDLKAGSFLVFGENCLTSILVNV